MKDLKLSLLGALLTAASAGTLFAAPRLCGNGLSPRLSGDAFAPVECSTTTKPSAMLPDLPVQPVKGAKTDLRDFTGRWEGDLAHALGRYELLLTVKTSWRGKAELTLEMKERQFRERLTDRLALVPAKERGAYEAVLTTTIAPDAALKGGARIGAAAAPEGAVPSERQLDLIFENGAAHRIFCSTVGKDEVRLRVFTAIPGAPLQKYETTLTRTKREAL